MLTSGRIAAQKSSRYLPTGRLDGRHDASSRTFAPGRHLVAIRRLLPISQGTGVGDSKSCLFPFVSFDRFVSVDDNETPAQSRRSTRLRCEQERGQRRQGRCSRRRQMVVGRCTLSASAERFGATMQYVLSAEHCSVNESTGRPLKPEDLKKLFALGRTTYSDPVRKKLTARSTVSNRYVGTTSRLCAGSARDAGRDACRGDSGGLSDVAGQSIRLESCGRRFLRQHRMRHLIRASILQLASIYELDQEHYRVQHPHRLSQRL